MMGHRKVLDIEYTLLPGSKRKTTDIIIERNGRVVVKPPLFINPEQADEIVRSKRMWIYKNLAEWRDLNRTAVYREWVNGETFLYLGSGYRLRVVENQDVPLLLKDGRFCIDKKCIENIENARAAFIEFYTEKAEKRIPDRVSLYAPQLGVAVNTITIKDIKYRWASCGINNGLQFHWRIMMAPVKIIDYIVVHELCHFKYKNHTDAFWNEVDKVMSDYPERKVWLKKNGAGLDL